MSYENTECPCGGKKPMSTMLCDDCLAEFHDRPELKNMNDETAPTESRRHSATILLALARGRKRRAITV